jgi:arylformamidase
MRGIAKGAMHAQRYRIIDISMVLGSFDYPGDVPFQVGPCFSAVAGANREFCYPLAMTSQSGTHIQGPHYFRAEGKRIHEFDLAAFEGPAFIADPGPCATGRTGFAPPNEITAERMRLVVGEVDLDGKILILRTGLMEQIIRSGDTSLRCGLTLDCAEFLVREKRVRMIGIDGLGVEHRPDQDYVVTKYLCQNDVLLLEQLVNLSAIGKREVWLEAFPLKIIGVEGTPYRAIVKEPW